MSEQDKHVEKFIAYFLINFLVEAIALYSLAFLTHAFRFTSAWTWFEMVVGFSAGFVLLRVLFEAYT